MTATTEETYEQRRARIQAQEQAEREHRATLLPIDPNSLNVTFGPVEGHHPVNPICSRCGGFGEDETAVSVTIDGQPGKVCTPCLDSAGEDSFPAALGQLVQGLEGISTALGSVPPDMQGDLLRIARQALEWLDDSDEPTGADIH